MLELRPNCECCNKELLPDNTEAMICSYECTFCKACVDTILENVCPNCGGGFCRRPIRPVTAWRNGVNLSHQPASTKMVNTQYTVDELKSFSLKIKEVAPEKR